MSAIHRIALLTDGVFPLVMGGMQKHSSLLLRYLLEQGKVVLLYHTGGQGNVTDTLNKEYSDRFEEVIIHFPKKGLLPGSYLRRSFTYSQQIARNLEGREDIDFIYAQGFTAWALIDEKRRGKKLPPIAVNFHGLEMFQPASGFKQLMIQKYLQGPVRFNLEHADVSYSLGGRLSELIKREVPKAVVSEIPIGLDADWASKKPMTEKKRSSPRRILFIGRDEYRKGLHVLYSLLSEETFADLEFHFVGPMDPPSGLEQANMTFHGAVKDEAALKAIIDDSDALLVPSLAEGMPTVILEAMARGLPILASDVGAVNEQVDGQNGILFTADSEEALSNALNEFIGWSAEQWLEKCEHSRNKFQASFTWEMVILRTLQDMQLRIDTR